MKNILFSTTSFDTIDNGPALFANILYDSLKASNTYDIRFVTEDLKLNPKKSKIYQLNLSKNMFNRFLYQFVRIFYYHKTAIAIHNDFKYDVLVYNNAFTGLLSTLFCKQKVIVMINDYNRLDFIHSNIRLNKNYFKSLLLFNLEKYSARNSDRIIVNSNFLRKKIVKAYKIQKSKVKVLKKGVNLQEYHYRLRAIFEKKINILFVKTAYLNGGLFDLIDAISIIGVVNIKLTVIGPYLHEIDTIKLKMKEKGVLNFEILGPTHPSIVRRYFDQADIFCVPSYKEALGVANMEALASGVPVISTNVGGIPEVLDYGNCGWLVEPGNPTELAVALTECISNDLMRIKKTEHGIKFVQQFDSKNLVDNFVNIIDNVEE